jgi:drug/metabolite transporter (DMT)-like permease
MKRPDLLSCLLMAFAGALWGVHGPALKFAYRAGFTPPQLVVGECLVGALFFGVAALFQRAPLPRSKVFWGRLLLAATIGTGVTLFLFQAYQLGPVPVGATLLFLYVPFTQVLNGVMDRRWPDRLQSASAVLVLAGAAVASDFVHLARSGNLAGAPHAILAAACFAAFFVITSRLGGTGTPVLRSLVCCAVSTAVLVVLGTARGWSLVPTVAPLTATLWFLLLGVFGQVIPVFVMVHFGPRTGSGLGSILTSTELPVAVVTSAIVLREPVGSAQVAGVLMVLAGIALPHVGLRGGSEVSKGH